MYLYRTNFSLVAPVPDDEYDAAHDYLQNDNMTMYLRDDCDDDLANAIESIEWDLRDEMDGVIDVTTNRELTAEECDIISSFISGQNSDGLGEGFEQNFYSVTCCRDGEPVDSLWCPCEDEEDCPGCGEPNEDMCSFDWQTNGYELKLVEKF